ncbi:uncharacterized protein EKO05_0006117 [Ascochyta rabiei]|uniref:Uncharacterized protein n=1 Tax=Didymella rabiei TaxID=5454 RepID=A0A163MJM9_DIDRA|nr:uncharacterized protein EKO05_0006117 [Ascochyta rabiei]KZM28776.1 hypothetical protein ST47_g53 [Ascochyta rabiei]UPX15676.1 hypothetical protein EKO05_0006117 [Ascochyta rabiei]
MAANNECDIAPQNTVTSHASISSAQAIGSSPIDPLQVKHEYRSPSTSIDFPLPPAPASSLQSISHKNTGGCKRDDSITPVDSEDASSTSLSPCLRSLLTSRHIAKAASSPERLVAPVNLTVPDSGAGDARSSSASSPSLVLKLKLRGIQAVLQEPLHSTDKYTSQLYGSPDGKRTSSEAEFEDDFDTDSEIDIMSLKNKVIKPTVRRKGTRISSQRSAKAKKHRDGSGSDFKDEDAMFDAGDEDSSPISPDSKLILSTNMLKRSERIMDPANPEHAKLIAAATKAGSEYYDSDMEDLPGDVKETNKPHLFRNVKWGFLATDYSQDAVFTTEPEFTQFVPGRFERLPDGTASDQKSKLIIKLTDKQYRQRIFLNPPPRDWNNQEAITALNKRTVQQIRRNTSIRFREVVEPYVMEEREWILAHLTEGKPSNGWKTFVHDFNRKFEGRRLEEGGVARPERSHSSLTKEVERFGKMYSKGIVPKNTSQGMEKTKEKTKGKKTE